MKPKIIVYTPAGEIITNSIIEAQQLKKLYGFPYAVIRDKNHIMNNPVNGII